MSKFDRFFDWMTEIDRFLIIKPLIWLGVAAIGMCVPALIVVTTPLIAIVSPQTAKKLWNRL